MNEAEAVREAYMNAVLNEDPESAIAQYADDTCRFPSGPNWFVHGVEEVRKEWSEWTDHPPVRYRAFRWVDGPHGEVEGSLAWIAGVLEQDYDSEHGPMSRQIRVSMILRKEADGWRIAMEHNSRPSSTPYEPGESKYR